MDAQLLNVVTALSAAVRMVVILAAIPLGVAGVVGFMAAFLQAATQIQEQSLSFIPKAAATATVVSLLFPAGMTILVEWFRCALQALEARP